MSYSWVDVDYDVTHFILAGLYVGLFVLCIICLIGRCDSQEYCWPLGPQAAFYLCMIAGTAGRVVFFTFAPFIREGWQFPISLNIFLNSYPSFFFFTGFSILMALWAEIYRNSSKQRSTDATSGGGIQIQHYRAPLVMSNVLMWAVVLGLYIAMMWQTGMNQSSTLSLRKIEAQRSDDAEMAVAETDIMKAIFLCCATIDLLILAGCALYGALVWRQFRAVYSTRKLAILKRIAVMTSIIACIFSIRAFFTIWALFWTVTYARLFFFDLLYFTLFELIPLCIMLIMLRGIDFGRAFDQFNRRGPLAVSEETEAILPRSPSPRP